MAELETWRQILEETAEIILSLRKWGEVRQTYRLYILFDVKRNEL